MEPLPDDAMKALDAAADAYVVAVKEILRRHSDEQLDAFVGEKRPIDDSHFDRLAFCQDTARFELLQRYLRKSVG